jgi:hypothetical protein
LNSTLLQQSISVDKKPLANLRVIQKNLVYIIGLSTKIASEDILKQPEFFGQYGKIMKIVVNKKHIYNANSSQGPSVSVYVTYYKKEDAAKTIQAIDGSIYDGRILRASFGTTKYCTFFLRNLSCPNPGCMYLHEQGDVYDSFTKEEMAMGKHHLYKSEETLQRKPIQRLGILLADQEPLPEIPLITIKAADALRELEGGERLLEEGAMVNNSLVNSMVMNNNANLALLKEKDSVATVSATASPPSELDSWAGKLKAKETPQTTQPTTFFDPFSPTNNLFGNFFNNAAVSTKPSLPLTPNRDYSTNIKDYFPDESKTEFRSSKQKSRFDFAQEDVQMQNDFRALLPNINVRFGQSKLNNGKNGFGLNNFNSLGLSSGFGGLNQNSPFGGTFQGFNSGLTNLQPFNRLNAFQNQAFQNQNPGFSKRNVNFLFEEKDFQDPAIIKTEHHDELRMGSE